MFAAKLEDAVRNTKGGQAAILMGFDGIPVDSFADPNVLDIETVGMEFSVVLKEVRKAAELLEAGAAEELMIRTDKLAAILRVVDDNYFVALTLAPDGNTGKARYLLRLMAPDFRGELS